MDEHVPDLEISRFVHDPGSVAAERRTAIERHAAACAECAATLDFYRVAEEDLKDAAVWLPADSTGLARIKAFARRGEVENAEADALLKPYFANPPMAARTNLAMKREFQTAGVVRRLNAHAHSLAETKPLAALTFADFAQRIADLLSRDRYPMSVINELRGTAWKERANALLQRGRYTEALDSLQCAERAYEQTSMSPYGLAAVELVRASVYYQLEELPKAETHVRTAESLYADLDQESRRITAVFLRGSIRYLAQDLHSAASIFRQVIDFGRLTNDATWIAKGSYALANCELDRGNTSEANTLFHSALAIFRETGAVAETIATEWGLSRVILHDGRATEASRRLREVMRGFEELGMSMNAVFASLDLADALIVLRQPRQVAKVAARSFRLLKEAGVLTSALTALAYLQEAAANDRLSPGTVNDVRTFLRRTERHPEMLFAPPPDTSN